MQHLFTKISSANNQKRQRLAESSILLSLLSACGGGSVNSSISTDGSQNLNGGVQYKIYFSPQQNFESTLGLLSVLKSELVKQNGDGIGHKIKWESI